VFTQLFKKMAGVGVLCAYTNVTGSSYSAGLNPTLK